MGIDAFKCLYLFDGVVLFAFEEVLFDAAGVLNFLEAPNRVELQFFGKNEIYTAVNWLL